MIVTNYDATHVSIDGKTKRKVIKYSKIIGIVLFAILAIYVASDILKISVSL